MTGFAMIFGDNFADNQARVADIRTAAGQCSAELPFLLLPVRIEARFVEFTEAAPVPTLGQPSPVPGPERLPARPQLPRTRTIRQLRVRVFPDDISILTHEPDLTIPERDAGIAHWREMAAAGADEWAQRAAWRALCARFGPNRAAWVARQTQPSVPIAADPDVVRALGDLDALHTALDAALADPSRLAGRYADLVDRIDRATPTVRSLPGSGLGRVRERGATADHKLDALAAAVRTGGEKAADERAAGERDWEPVAQAQQRLRGALKDLRGRPADPLPGEFVLADEKTKSAPWTRPARAVALPVRFVVVTVSSGQISHVVAGNPVPAELTLGLDPTGVDEPPHVDEHGRLVAGDSLRWLVDYDTALAVGMAVNVPITADEAARGFDQVFVLGIRGGDPAVTATRLSDLLDGHHYTAGGLSLLPNGTPTNNTDAATSGYGRREDAEHSFDIERRAPLAAELPVPTDGWRLARALGLSADTFGHVAHADGQDIAEAQLANAVLWPATGGYAVEELLGRVISRPTRDLLRWFATTYVVGRGTLPALRVGHQPYGVLPTTAFTYFEPIGLPTDPGRRFEELLRDVLLTARKDWAAQVPRLAHAYSNQPADRRQRVLNVLGLDATARGHRQHYAVNGAWAGATLHVGVPADADHTVVRQGAFAVVQRFAEAIAKASGFTAGPTAAGGAVTPDYRHFFEELDQSRPYEMQYLDHGLGVPQPNPIADLAVVVAALLKSGLDDLANSIRPLWTDVDLLHALLRMALLASARDVALRILAVEGVLSDADRAEPGRAGLWVLSGIGDRDRRVSRWSFLFSPLSRLDGGLSYVNLVNNPGSLYGYLRANGDQPMSAYLANQGDNPLAHGFNGPARGQHTGHLKGFADYARAVSRFGALARPRAESAAIEHLDTCSHRLDAWLLGLANRRLDQTRMTHHTGIHLGAFGWLENLRPAAAPVPATGVPPLLETGQPVYESTLNGGFIHTPSVDHGATAALLRSGYLAQTRAGNDLAVNISSRRVRSALALLDGIAAGNDLGALLGYQFERDLHDAGELLSPIYLDGSIPGLRARFPSVAGVDQRAGDPGLGERQVVDGLSLLAAVRAAVGAQAGQPLGPLLRADSYKRYPYGVADDEGKPLLPSDPGAPEIIVAALDRMADTVDAVSDLVLTEGMYQIVRGNHPRAAAVLSALSEGRTPVWPEVVDTPATGNVVSHRVLLQLTPGAGRPEGWAAPSARADVEPALNHFLGGLIGPPGETWVQVVTDAAYPTHVADVSLTALEVQPIDLLAILASGLDDGLTELTVRVLDTLRPVDVRENEPAPALRLELARHAEWPEDVRSLAETAALLEVAAQLVGRARAATPTDYQLAETVTATSPAADVAELAGRVGTAVSALRGLGVTLLGLLSDGADSDPALLSGDVVAYVAGKANVYRGGAAPGQHLARLDALWIRRLGFRSALLTALGFGITGVHLPTRWVSRDQVATQWLEAAETALIEVADRLRRADAAGSAAGAGVEPLLAAARAVFTEAMPVLPRIVIANPTELAAALTAQAVADPAVVADRWLAGVAPVRENLAALTTMTALADAFGRPTPTAVAVQLPDQPGEAWTGEALPERSGNRLSLTIVDGKRLATDGSPSVALLLDTWDELIPAESLTTGVTLNYDQPASHPPQCLLLAVPPVMAGSWEWEHLIQTLRDTLDLVKLRAVEPEHLQDDLYGQLLPGLLYETVRDPVAAPPVPVGEGAVNRRGGSSAGHP